MASAGAPLIVTATLADDAFVHFDELRRRHFPPEQNLLHAHVTLFHQLPGEQLERIRGDLAAVELAWPVEAAVARVRSLGRGVAFDLESEGLLHVRRDLAQRWEDLLVEQDRRWSRPHVTVQNKVEPEQARRLLAELAAGFEPWPTQITGARLWRYLGGPWEAVAP